MTRLNNAIKGVQLHNEKDLTRPAVLEVITPTEVRLTISEGRYHQEADVSPPWATVWLACIVNVLVRLPPDPDLEPGEYRPLTEDEIASVGMPPR